LKIAVLAAFDVGAFDGTTFDADRAKRVRIAMQFSSASISILPYVAFNKDAFPQPPAQQAGWTKSFSPPKQAQVNLARVSKPNSSKPTSSKSVSKGKIRLSFALRSQAAQLSKAIARNIDLPFWNLSLGPALASRLSPTGSRQPGLARRTLASARDIHWYLRGQ